MSDDAKALTKKTLITELKELLQNLYLYKYVYANLDFGEIGDIDHKSKYD